LDDILVRALVAELDRHVRLDTPKAALAGLAELRGVLSPPQPERFPWCRCNPTSCAERTTGCPLKERSCRWRADPLRNGAVETQVEECELLLRQRDALIDRCVWLRDQWRRSVVEALGNDPSYHKVRVEAEERSWITDNIIEARS
jgi:hypothetical protein